MSSYILSNANRFYTALEGAYGTVGTITAANRIPALKLSVSQQLAVTQRKDKTGSRTFVGLPPGGRKKTSFQVKTYMTSWQQPAGPPGYGPLFQAALGAAPLQYGGGTAASATATGRLGFQAAHGLAAGQAVTSNGELRFVAAIVDAQTVQLNAPFTTLPSAGAPIGATITYSPFDRVTERKRLRLLVARHGCPALAVRGSHRPNGDRGQRRLSRVSLQRSRKGRDRQQ